MVLIFISFNHFNSQIVECRDFRFPKYFRTWQKFSFILVKSFIIQTLFWDFTDADLICNLSSGMMFIMLITAIQV